MSATHSPLRTPAEGRAKNTGLPLDLYRWRSEYPEAAGVHPGGSQVHRWGDESSARLASPFSALQSSTSLVPSLPQSLTSTAKAEACTQTLQLLLRLGVTRCSFCGLLTLHPAHVLRTPALTSSHGTSLPASLRLRLPTVPPPPDGLCFLLTLLKCHA